MLFVNSKNMARDLYSFLMRSGYHERTSSLHGDITQAERERGLRHMKQNPRSIMVATDLGARGLPSRPLVGWPDILPFAPTFPGRNACLGKSDHHMVGLDESHGGGGWSKQPPVPELLGPIFEHISHVLPPCADPPLCRPGGSIHAHVYEAPRVLETHFPPGPPKQVVQRNSGDRCWHCSLVKTLYRRHRHPYR